MERIEQLEKLVFDLKSLLVLDFEMEATIVLRALESDDRLWDIMDLHGLSDQFLWHKGLQKVLQNAVALWCQKKELQDAYMVKCFEGVEFTDVELERIRSYSQHVISDEDFCFHFDKLEVIRQRKVLIDLALQLLEESLKGDLLFLKDIDRMLYKSMDDLFHFPSELTDLHAIRDHIMNDEGPLSMDTCYVNLELIHGAIPSVGASVVLFTSKMSELQFLQDIVQIPLILHKVCTLLILPEINSSKLSDSFYRILHENYPDNAQLRLAVFDRLEHYLSKVNFQHFLAFRSFLVRYKIQQDVKQVIFYLSAAMVEKVKNDFHILKSLSLIAHDLGLRIIIVCPFDSKLNSVVCTAEEVLPIKVLTFSAEIG